MSKSTQGQGRAHPHYPRYHFFRDKAPKGLKKLLKAVRRDLGRVYEDEPLWVTGGQLVRYDLGLEAGKKVDIDVLVPWLPNAHELKAAKLRLSVGGSQWDESEATSMPVQHRKSGRRYDLIKVERSGEMAAVRRLLVTYDIRATAVAVNVWTRERVSLEGALEDLDNRELRALRPLQATRLAKYQALGLEVPADAWVLQLSPEASMEERLGLNLGMHGGEGAVEVHQEPKGGKLEVTPRRDYAPPELRHYPLTSPECEDDIPF